MSKVIHNKNLPVNPFRALYSGVVIWLLMDRLRPSVAIQAVVWTLYGLVFIAILVSAIKQEMVELKELED